MVVSMTSGQNYAGVQMLKWVSILNNGMHLKVNTYYNWFFAHNDV